MMMMLFATHSPYDLCTLVHLQFVVIGWLSRDASFCLLCMESDKGGVQGSFFGLRSIWPKNPQHKLSTHILFGKPSSWFFVHLLYYLTYFNTVIFFNTFWTVGKNRTLQLSIHPSTYLYLSLDTPRISPSYIIEFRKGNFDVQVVGHDDDLMMGRCLVMGRGAVLMWSVHCLLKDKMPCCRRR